MRRGRHLHPHNFAKDGIMRAYELRGEGLDQLVVTERPVTRPGAGEVLVRMRATSLNYRDLLIARGQYRLGKLTLPLVPLSDGAGEVIAVGAGVSHLAPGDRVVSSFFRDWLDGPPDPAKQAASLGGGVDGVLAENVILSAAAAVKFPDTLSFEEAATLPCAGVTVWVALVVLGGVKAGETVLAMGTGGVSIFALQMAKQAGARVILTSSDDGKLARGRELGADETINYVETPDWDARARELTGGRGVDHILEVCGAKTAPQSLRALRDGGHLALVGVLSGAPADRDAAARNERGIRVDGIYVGSVRHLESLCQSVGERGLRPVVDRVFPFDEVKQAYEYLSSSRHFGKIVIRL
jgi:NADPH:quinone reductase-like Zn-dependent oxidoreductase